MINVDTPTLLMIAAAYLIAALVKGVTGLGFSSTCLPILVFAVGLKTALPLVIIPSIASNLVVMRQAGDIVGAVRQFWPMLIATVPGLLIGLYFLSAVNGGRLAAALGLVLILYALFTLARPHVALSGGVGRLLAMPVGFTTGLVNGLTGSQVMPVLPYLMALNLPPQRFVQSINCMFTLSSLVMVSGLATLGLATLETTVISIAGLVCVAIGVGLGAQIRERLNAQTFRRVVLWVLMALGASLLIQEMI